MGTHSDVSVSIALVTVIALTGCSSEPTAPLALHAVPPLTAQNSVVGVPIGWQGFLGQPPSFTVGVESGDTHSGARAAFLTNAVPIPAASTFTTIVQRLRPDVYLRHRVKLSGWLRPSGVTLPNAAATAAGQPPPVSGLWMRVDGVGTILKFDNMQNRPVVGTAGWQQVSVVLDVPTYAIGIAFGVIFSGTGQLLVDDLALETVSSEVPTTDLFGGAVSDSSNSDAVVAAYASYPAMPNNLDFGLVGHASTTSRPSDPVGFPISWRVELNRRKSLYGFSADFAAAADTAKNFLGTIARTFRRAAPDRYRAKARRASSASQ